MRNTEKIEVSPPMCRFPVWKSVLCVLKENMRSIVAEPACESQKAPLKS